MVGLGQFVAGVGVNNLMAIRQGGGFKAVVGIVGKRSNQRYAAGLNAFFFLDVGGVAVGVIVEGVFGAKNL